jgi:uncharacterized protein (TIGR03086 family)
MELLEALDVAVEAFGSSLERVGEGEWSGPTPCDDWDVRYLVAHVVGGNRFAASVLDGNRAADAMAEVMSRPQLGDEPIADLVSSARAQRERFAVEGALARTVDHPWGEVSGQQFLEMRVFDVTLHTWDLGSALGQPVVLDPGLVDRVLRIMADGPEGMGFGLTPRGGVGPRADARDRLLDATGRDPRWVPLRPDEVLPKLREC